MLTQYKITGNVALTAYLSTYLIPNTTGINVISTDTLYTATGITPIKKPIKMQIAFSKLKLRNVPIISFYPVQEVSTLESIFCSKRYHEIVLLHHWLAKFNSIFDWVEGKTSGLAGD